MKILYIVLLLACSSPALFAQGTDRKLLAPNGAVFTAGKYQLSFSLGEVVVLPTPGASITGNNPVSFVTTGFQQPHVASKGELVDGPEWISAYPNPAVNIVRVDIHGLDPGNNAVRVTNMAGQIVMTPFQFINGSLEIKLDRLAAGTYIVSVMDKESAKVVSTKIIKQNQ
jgi:hypothetical protein